MTIAVTTEAPAVSKNESRPERNSERHADFLPTGNHYRMTGEMPANESADTEEASAASAQEKEKKEKKTPPVNEGESATPNSDTAAASEAAKAAEEEKEAKQGKTASTSENRWQKISRENKELRERLQRLETSAQPQARDDKQASQPAAESKTPPAAKAGAATKPKIDDVDEKTGKAKYATFAEYEDAKDAWLLDEGARKYQETNEKSAKERQQTDNERIIDQTIKERVTAARKTYADYDDVMQATLAQKNEHGQDALFYTKGSHIDGFFLDSDRGQDVLYEIGKNFDQHKHIFARDAQGKYLLNPVRQVRELAKIENALSPHSETAAASQDKDKDKEKNASDKTSSARPVTQAPRPPHQVSGKGNAAKDSVEQAVEDSDQETYMREQNARDLARRKKGK